MKWSSNNVACRTVWTALMVFDQIAENQSFKSTGEIKIGDLPFFPQDGSMDVVETRANSLSIQLDKSFRMIFGATYEESMTQISAVSSMSKLLKDKEQTITNLADKADDQYLFFKEEKIS